MPNSNLVLKTLPAFLILLLLFSRDGAARNSSPQSKDTSLTQKHEWRLGMFVSGGACVMAYQNDVFFRKTTHLTFTPANAAGYTSPQVNNYFLTVGTIALSQIHYSNYPIGPSMDFGTQFTTRVGKKIMINHIFHLGYTQTSGTYSYLAKYTEDYSRDAYSTHTNYSDTAQAKYTHLTGCLGYKIQAAYRSVFLSMGVDFDLNFMQTNQQIKEHGDGTWRDGEAGKEGTHTENNSSSSSGKGYYLDFPLQFGAGVFLKEKWFTLKPAFYFTSNYHGGYYTSNLALDFLFNIKKEVTFNN